MYMAVVTLIPNDQVRPGSLEDALVTDILWSAAVPADGLEHVHSRATADHIELTLFHRSTAAADALSAAERICRQAISSSPTLYGWQLARG